VNAVTTGPIGADELEKYRRELVGFCYRMLGSIHEAEDAVQETMLRAWRALARFEDRGGLRPWLYRIATNVCFDLMKGRGRRALPIEIGPAGTPESRLVDALPEVTWIQPAPDGLVLPPEGDPAEHVVSRESVRLAFIAALQHLAPRQRAVLILRDVLRLQAAEVAVLLETSADAVNSALRRARSAVGPINRDDIPTEPSAADKELLAAYIDAFERQDVDALVSLLREDAIVEMPPFNLWLRGRDDIHQWLTAVEALRDHVVVPIRANGAPAFAHYRRRSPGEPHTALAIHLLDLVGGQISAIHAFIDATLFERFGLPPHSVP
jgi:RNA polymerase sigma-70 factor, ECF subfamily